MIKGDLPLDNIKWFIGIVKDSDNGGNFVKVRIFGIHPFETPGQENGPAFEAVSDGDLPPALVIYPPNSSNENHNLQEGEWVFGFFVDGDSAQQPVIVGKIGMGFRAENINVSGGTTSGTPSETGISDKSIGDGALINSGKGPKIQPNPSQYYSNIPGSTNQQKAFNFLTTYFHEEHGVELPRAKMIAAGIVASLIGESSSKLNPNAVGDGGTSYGIAQWHKERMRALKRMCNDGDIDCQLNYLITELKSRGYGLPTEGSERKALRGILKSTSARDAAIKWTILFERPANAWGEARKRAQYANGVLRKYGPQYQPATKGTSTS